MAQSLFVTPARSDERVDWTGSFSQAYAYNPTPVLSASTTVTFEVSRPMNDPTTNGAQMRVFDDTGTQVAWCYNPLACGTTSNPAPGSSRSYYAEVWVWHAGVLLKDLTSPTVTVTDPGWTGTFTAAYAVNPTPALTAATTVNFMVSNTLSAAGIRVFDDTGTQVAMCYWGSGCGITSNPAPGTSQSYYAELWVERGGVYVPYATSPTVTVTDPGWTGAFSQAYADNPTPALTASTGVNFVVTAALGSAAIRVFDDEGTEVATCYSGSSCGTTSNPAPGTSRSYYAEVWAQQAGVLVKAATSPTVTVTDPGWTGAFSQAYADNPTPVLTAGAGVNFVVSPALGSAAIVVFDDTATWVATCYSGSWCGTTSNPAPGTSRSYYAEVWAQQAGVLVKAATSPTVTVTDPGWTGSFYPVEDAYIQLNAGQDRSIFFTWDQPLGGVGVRIRSSDGDVVRGCTGANDTSCWATVWLGSGQIRSYWAEVVMQLPGGTEVVSGTSQAIVVTTLSDVELVDVLQNGTDSQLAALLGPGATPAAVAALRAGAIALATDEAACLEIGALDPTHPLNSSATTTQLACSGGSGAASLALATAVGIGVLVATLVDYGSSDHSDQPAPEPSPQPQPDPIVPGGPNDPPATQVDTCQLPASPDGTFKHYTSDKGHSAIEGSGRIASPGGTNYLTTTTFASGADAMAALALSQLPTGYFVVPEDRIVDLQGPGCVDPAEGQPGGGVEYWTNHPIDANGLQWFPISP